MLISTDEICTAPRVHGRPDLDCQQHVSHHHTVDRESVRILTSITCPIPWPMNGSADIAAGLCEHCDEGMAGLYVGRGEHVRIRWTTWRSIMAELAEIGRQR